MIGLLLCDHVRPEFREVAGDYDDMFRRWLSVDLRVYDVASGELPRDVGECSAYVSTGSRASVYDDERWIAALAHFVRQVRAESTPFLGVCFGHQMIAHALGGRVDRCSRGWGVGVHEFQVTAPECWMKPPLDTVRVVMSCQDQVEALPSGAIVLAGNDHCPVGMFRLDNLLGLQGHPEFPLEYAEALARSRAGLIGEERLAAALASFQQRPDSLTLSHWAVRFMSGDDCKRAT